jgi:hypothetical protein
MGGADSNQSQTGINKIILNKILITIQGRTLLLFYQLKQGLQANGTGSSNYIQVLPSAELARFNLKGLTPEMFCVNIADMVNIRGMYTGQVENEKQIPVAKWALNYDEFLQLKNALISQLSHKQIVKLLSNLPGYVGESDDQYIDFEERVVTHPSGDHTSFSGYRLSIMTEEVEGHISTHAYYYLDTCTGDGWQDMPPPQGDYAAVRSALENKLQQIREAGVRISAANDETDYLIASTL